MVKTIDKERVLGKMKRSRTMGDETQCPDSKRGLLYFKVNFLDL